MAFAALGSDDGEFQPNPRPVRSKVGMEPTLGLVPRTEIIPTSPYLDTQGPLARTVADVAQLLAVIAGPDQSDPGARVRVASRELAAIRD